MSGHLMVGLDGGTALFTTRRGGVSEGPYASLNLGPWTDDDPAHVAANRARVRALADGARLVQGHQVHGTRVVVDADDVEDADGQVATAVGAAPIVLVADCLPIALVAPEAVAALHAGWRGLAGGIVAEGVATLRRAGASRVAAAVGPCARACCYEVGDEVRAAFGTTGRTLDLAQIAAGQLAAAGVDEVHDTGSCTICATDEDGPRFFSHRRDGGVTGRQAGVVWRS
jgi:purine-nucleoside/S-methyl-5'-thioadenosine phosphorylase / adenosine deaminase